MTSRNCSRITCDKPAVATLTAAYADKTVVIGPLSPQPQSGQSDLCAEHAASFVAPAGWKVIVAPQPLAPQDDLLALAKALGNADADRQSRLKFNDFTQVSQEHSAEPKQNKPNLKIVREN